MSGRSCRLRGDRHDAQVVQPQHAKAFANGMEFFATYGGCTAAGAAGMATLKVIQEEKFQERAERVGRHLTAGLMRLKEVCAHAHARFVLRVSSGSLLLMRHC